MGTVIQIRGTSGSGKTWVMRGVMKELARLLIERTSVYTEGRKKPEYYKYGCGHYVCGHYESTCGGCDNIGSAAKVYELYQKIFALDSRAIILSEGLLLSEDSKWTQQLDDVKIVYLATDIEKCIEQIKARREAAGNDKPLNENNTRQRIRAIQSSKEKLRNLPNCEVVTQSSSQATRKVLKWCGF